MDPKKLKEEDWEVIREALMERMYQLADIRNTPNNGLPQTAYHAVDDQIKAIQRVQERLRA